MSTTKKTYKYDSILHALDPHRLYTPACIARFAFEHGLLPDEGESAEEKAVYRRIRIYMVMRSKRWQFPREGDGTVTRQGLPACPGWFGKRWLDKNF